MSCAKRAVPIEMQFWIGVGWRVLDGRTLAQPGEYGWTVRVRRLCGPLSNYFDHLLIINLQGPDAAPGTVLCSYNRQQLIATMSTRERL